MYTKFKLSNIQVGEIKIGNVEVEAKYTPMEVANIYDLTKTAIKEIPAMLDDLKAGALKFIEIDKEMEELARKDFEEEMEKKKKTILEFQAGVRDIFENFKTPEEDILEGLRE